MRAAVTVCKQTARSLSMQGMCYWSPPTSCIVSRRLTPRSRWHTTTAREIELVYIIGTACRSRAVALTLCHDQALCMHVYLHVYINLLRMARRDETRALNVVSDAVMFAAKQAITKSPKAASAMLRVLVRKALQAILASERMRETHPNRVCHGPSVYMGVRVRCSAESVVGTCLVSCRWLKGSRDSFSTRGKTGRCCLTEIRSL